MAEPMMLLRIGRQCACRRGQPEETAVAPVREALAGVFALRGPRRLNPMGRGRVRLPKQDAKRPLVDEFDAHDRMPGLVIKPA